MAEKVIAESRRIYHHIPYEYIAFEVSRLCVDDWRWRLRTTIEPSGNTNEHIEDPTDCEADWCEELTIDQAVEWYRNHMEINETGHRWPIELEFNSSCKDGLYVRFSGHPKAFLMELRGWELLGVAEDRNYAVSDLDERRWVSTEYLLWSGETFLLLAKTILVHSYGDPVFDGRVIDKNTAAEWFFDNELEAPELLRPLLNHRILTVENIGDLLSHSDQTPESPPASIEYLEDTISTVLYSNSFEFGLRTSVDQSSILSAYQKPKTPRELRDERDAALLAQFNPTAKNHPTYAELSNWLEEIAPLKDWTMVESSSIRDCLLRAWQQMSDTPWPFDQRGKRSNR